MTVDLSVVATPLYFGSMALEQRRLAARAAEHGPSAADYDPPDTRTSLAMGVGSLAVPIAGYVFRSFALGRSRWAKIALAAAAGAAAVTTIADVIERRPATRAARRRARQVARIGSVTTIATGGLVLCTTAARLGAPKRQWAVGGHRRDLGTGVAAWTAAMLGWDFIYYWNHRLMHEVRALWAIHVVHHSSERFNLSTALRQPVASTFGVFVPYGWLSRLGVRPSLVEYARGLNLIYQFWIHTDTIRTIGAAEAVLNTPSHHRVHHGSNERYLDRNHAGILVVWDRLFGTFQRELPHLDPVVYGLTENVGSFNPWRVATHEHRNMFRDVAESTTWRDRLGFVLRGPGWAHRRRAAVEGAAMLPGPASD
jgi:sterol desaturase/sphingolipid hydroxylase (fatty acid hydroxylase superfamily)